MYLLLCLQLEGLGAIHVNYVLLLAGFGEGGRDWRAIVLVYRIGLLFKLLLEGLIQFQALEERHPDILYAVKYTYHKRRFSITTADELPAPSDMAASPRFFLFKVKELIKDATILAPVMPIGCPNATDPPWMLVLSIDIPRVFIVIREEIENNSPNSKRSISSALSFRSLRTFFTA